MRLDRAISRSRIIDLESTDLAGALQELVGVATARMTEKIDREAVIADLLKHESTISSYLGNGVALPHARLKMKRKFLLAVGRCPNGIVHEGAEEYAEVRLVVLLLASEEGKNYLNFLASLARLFAEEAIVERITATPDLERFRDAVMRAFGGITAKPEKRQIRYNRLFVSEAEKVARSAKCAAILFFSDTFAGGVEVGDILPRFRTVLVSRAGTPKRYQDRKNVATTIEVRSFSKARISQARSAILIGITSGLFRYNDRLCCLGGIPGSNQLDTIVVYDIEREFDSIIMRDTNILPASVKLEVLERMLGIATDISVEGREGRPMGALFVIGDTEKVNRMIKPLVLNPFFGYKAEERNVLNPFMDETIKEFSVIDGGFVIQGDGTIDSAGSLVHAPSEYYHSLPSGLGARHAAAGAISLATDCLAICVSESTGQVTLFRRGVMLPLLEKSIGSSNG